jgi:hypothetical protein
MVKQIQEANGKKEKFRWAIRLHAPAPAFYFLCTSFFMVVKFDSEGLSSLGNMAGFIISAGAALGAFLARKSKFTLRGLDRYVEDHPADPELSSTPEGHHTWLFKLFLATLIFELIRRLVEFVTTPHAKPEWAFVFTLISTIFIASVCELAMRIIYRKNHFTSRLHAGMKLFHWVSLSLSLYSLTVFFTERDDENMQWLTISIICIIKCADLAIRSSCITGLDAMWNDEYSLLENVSAFVWKAVSGVRGRICVFEAISFSVFSACEIWVLVLNCKSGLLCSR